MKVLAIAWNKFRKAERDRGLYHLVAFVLLPLAAALIHRQASLGQEARLITNAGLSAVCLWGLSVFTDVGLASKKIAKGPVAVLLKNDVEISAPVCRFPHAGS